MKSRTVTFVGLSLVMVLPLGLILWVQASRGAQDGVGNAVPLQPSNTAIAMADVPLVAPADAPATQPSGDQNQAGLAAAQEFDLGEKALAAHQPADAITHYKAVINNRFADETTVRKANEQLAVAQSQLAQQGAAPAADTQSQASAAPTTQPQVDPQRAEYESAVADMHAGRGDAARTKLQELSAANYQPPIFRRTPKELLVELEVQTGQSSFGAAPAAPVAAPAADAAPIAPTPAPAPVAAPPVAQAPAAPSPAPATATPAPAASGSPTALDRLAAQAANEKIAQEQRVYRARGLVDMARDAYTRGDKPGALRYYSQAVDLDATNQAAQSGKTQLLDETGRAQQPAVASQFRNQLEVDIQDIQFRFNTAIRDSRAAIQADDFATAQRRLEDARVARAFDPGVFPAEQLREMDATIASLDQQLKDEKANYDQHKAEASRQDAITRERARAEQQRLERERTVENLVKLSKQDIDAENYSAALGVLDQILVLDPKNDYATGMRQFVEDRAIVREQAKYRELYDVEYAKQLNNAEEVLIPYDDIIRYPSNWPDISESRDEEVKGERGLSSQDRTTTALLNKALPPTNFEGSTFTEAIDYLRDLTGANILVITRALDAAGVDRSTPITLKLNNVKFSKALDLILQTVGGQTKLGYEVDEGVITISTADQLNQNVQTQVYEVQDLLIQIPQFQANDASSVLSSLSQGSGGGTYTVQNNGGAGGGGGGGGQSQSNSNSNSLSGGSTGNTQNTQTKQQLMDQIVKLVTDTVATDTWKVNAGTVGAISELVQTGQLVVTQTPENQGKLQDLLDKIREKRDIQVTIEVRFLTVTRNFVEALGMNLDASFNINRQPNSVFSSIPVNHILDTGFTTGSNGITTGAPGSIGAGANPITSSLTYLDDFQVNLMLQAVEASANNTLVTAPRVTVFNGVSAVLAVGDSFDYVSNLTPVIGTGSSVVGYSAVLGSASAGIQLFVTPTVSADRKYVTLNLQPRLTLPPVLTPFNLTAPASQTTSVSGGSTVVTGQGASSAVTETIQLISQSVTEVETLVSVPDGGTLMLGGQTIAGEAEREQGVPVLSKVPFLKRLFTNTASAKDEQVVLILVKPTILIQREQEEKFFPLLSNRPTGR